MAPTTKSTETNPNPPRARGRPKGSVKAAAESVSSPAPASSEKRSRGRPKKQATIEQTTNGTAGAKRAAPEDGTPAPAAKRGRGRPPGPKKAADIADGTADETMTGVDDGEAAKQDAPVKRGRGRPPGPKKAADIAGGTADETMTGVDDGEAAKQDAPVKRGRGRPKKVNTSDGDKPATSTPAPKRRAGRPKKVAEPDENEVEENKPADEDSDEAMKGADDVEDDKDVADQINGDDEEMKEAVIEDDEAVAKLNNGRSKPADEEGTDDKTTSENTNGLEEGEKNAFDEVRADTGEVKIDVEKEQNQKSAEINENNKSVIQDEKREAAIPSSILEKGIIYFFFRGRVGVEDPQGIEDVARSYIILRPLPLGAKIGEGPLEDSGNARLLALPKKVLPKSKQDRFLMFVEQPKASIKDLREQFSSNQYVTNTVGTSKTPAATPFAEGVYAITSTGRESHLAYHITVPEEIGEVQKELGLYKKGSYVVSVKNPDAPGPANATLDNPAKYPEELQKKFNGLRWMSLEPELLNYQNTQFLIIGEGLGDLGNSVQEMSKDAKDDEKEKPAEEIEKLEEEDHDRVEHLKEDDPVFADLGLSSKEYPTMQTTW